MVRNQSCNIFEYMFIVCDSFWLVDLESNQNHVTYAVEKLRDLPVAMKKDNFNINRTEVRINYFEGPSV